MSMLKADRPSLSKANALKNIRSDQELMHINVVTTKEFHKEMKH